MLSCAALMLATSMVIGQTQDKESPQTTVPKNVLAEFEYLVGKWTAQFNGEGVTGTGVSTVSWSIDKQAITQDQSWELTQYGKLKAVVLVGWDTAKQELVEANFFSGGGGAVRRYKLQSAGVWVGEAQHFHPDGKAETSKVRIERKNADEYTWTETDRSLGGPSQEPVEVRFRRVK